MGLFSNYHNISHADGVFHGNSSYSPGISKWLRDGQPITAPFRYDWDAVAPQAASSIGLVPAQTWLTNLTVLMSGSFVTAGVATMDIPRAVAITTTTLGTAASWVFYGTDYYNEALSEKVGIPTSTGNQTVNGKKAFKTITCAVLKNTVARGTMSVGRADIFGLPFAIAGAWDMLTGWADTTACTIDSTHVVAADATSPATAVTGDVRGTFSPSTGSDGSKKFRVWFTAKGKDTRNNLYGVPQFSG